MKPYEIFRRLSSPEVDALVLAACGDDEIPDKIAGAVLTFQRLPLKRFERLHEDLSQIFGTRLRSLLAYETHFGTQAGAADRNAGAADDHAHAMAMVESLTYADLVAIEHENWVAYLTGVVSCANRATVTRAGGVVTILTGLPFDEAEVTGSGTGETRSVG